jgi:hypothetical protein
MRRMTSQRLLPALPADRIQVVGQALYGQQWKFRMARAMGVGRTTLFEWLRGSASPADLDDLLALTIRREQENRVLVYDHLDAIVIELLGRGQV